MNGFHRLHNLRMANDAKGFEMEEMRPRFEQLAARHENGTAPRAVSAHQLFQTPQDLASRLVGLLDLRPGMSLLEPSAGLGRLIQAAQTFNLSRVTAIEIAQQCASELFREFEYITLLQRDFLTVSPLETGLFDAVAMNPPFTMRGDIKHILHAVKFLAPGGKLAALCLDTPHRERALRHLAATWEQVPAGAFKTEGTGVACVLLTISN